MDSWVLVADQPRDLVARDVPHVVVSSEDYIVRPYMLGGARQKIIILARSYNYQTAGYYCALLAEARGHRVMPSVETMLGAATGSCRALRPCSTSGAAPTTSTRCRSWRRRSPAT